MDKRTWRIAATDYRLHLVGDPDPNGLRRTACGHRYRFIDRDLDALILADYTAPASPTGFDRCRDCRTSGLVEDRYGIVVTL